MELWAVVLVAGVALVAVVLRRAQDPAGLRAAEAVSRQLGQLQAELTRVGRAQDELRRDVQQGRLASVHELAEAAQGIRGDIGRAHRALVEVRAVEEGRARHLELATHSLRRLEAVLAGSSTRGAAGENILVRALAQLPPDLLAVNVSFGGRIVEFALCLPGGRVLPIDSKWTSAAALERLAESEDVEERRRLTDQVVRDLRLRIREMAKYLDPARTLSLALLAVPDAAYLAAPEVHAEGYRDGVLVVPYSLALPYVLALYRLVLRFGATVDDDGLSGRLRSLDEALRRMDEEVEGRLSRSLVQLQNARDALRERVAEARRLSGGLVRESVSESGEPAFARLEE